ncbi:hypothetical protein D9M72_434130 [compost metagenome]
MPFVHYDVACLANGFEPAILVVDQGLQGTHVEYSEPTRLLIRICNPGQQREHRGLGLARSCLRRDHNVAASQYSGDRLFLNVAQALPLLLPYPASNRRGKEVKGGALQARHPSLRRLRLYRDRRSRRGLR